MTTINEPPTTATFDIANKHCELHDHGGLRGRPTCSPPVAAADLLTAIAQLETTLSTSQCTLWSSQHNKFCGSYPKTSSDLPHGWDQLQSIFPALPSPSNIPCFMKYAKDRLKITNLASYINALQENWLGPDILGDTDMATLTSSKIGILYGDALHLCKAAPS